ncbi:MAG: hypothetical protein CW716_03845 [Candidatus Bathyarchaeum sp.]|nr:MAG: hypothetical protein CW716_03845 [Candidatus Bathyarchaeum sp.]
MQFADKVEKPSKILTMGIGIYFIIFAFCWVLFTTPLLAPPVPEFVINPDSPEEPLVVGEAITFLSVGEDPDGEIVTWAWHFGEEGGSTIKEEDPEITHTYNAAGNYTVKLTVVDDHGISMSNTTTITIKTVS